MLRKMPAGARILLLRPLISSLTYGRSWHLRVAFSFMPRFNHGTRSTIALTLREQRGSQVHTPVALGTPMLIVDNDRRISMSLAFMLSTRGYEDVRAVRSAPRARAVAARFHPGIVFLDIERPDLEGLDLARQLRRAASGHAMRLIALTSSAAHELREEARIAGFERYFLKPLSHTELDKVLRLPRNVAPS